MSDSQTTDDRHICDYPICSVRGSGHPLACNCRSSTIPTTEPDWRADPLEHTPIVRGYQPQTAPGHTDLMVSPESLDAWLDANPPPDEIKSTMPINMIDPISDPDAWDADRLAQEVAFTISPAGRLRREDREIAFALEIERLRAALSHVRNVLRDTPDAWPSWDGETGKIIRKALLED